MKSFDFVEMFKEKNGLGSDYMAAKMLGVTRQSISHYKNGRPLDEDLALKIAEDLNIEPSEILYVIAAEKSKKPETRKAWIKLAKLAGKTSAISAIGLTLSLAPVSFNPAISTAYAANLNDNNIHYTYLYVERKYR